jgi:hypothetical protein
VGSRARCSALVRAAVVGAALVAASSCGASHPAPTSGSSAGSPAATSPGSSAASGSSAGSSSGGTSTAASCDSGGWRSAPLSVSHSVAAPTVPVVTAVRAAAHPECGYDRLVLDLAGPVPSYDIRYVTQVIADPSGKPITLSGGSFLLITLHPAQAHTETGASTIIRAEQTPGYPVLKSYAVAGDFEGVFTIALGLHGTTSIRVGELSGHLYLDVKA